MNWKYYDPKFKYEEVFQDTGWPWAGHKYFAYDLVANLKPKRIVELGTHYGTSFFSFCQAAKDKNIDVELNAVDTWKGDDQAGFYGEDVIEKVKKIQGKFYPKLKIKLIRKTFDEAVLDFGSKTIDLLHIDGLHTYEAVKHDFENWLGKVSDSGMIILHDISEKEGDFGVYKLWDELKIKYKSLEFIHSHGLGIIFLEKNPFYSEIAIFQSIWQKYYSITSENREFRTIKLKLEKNNKIKSRMLKNSEEKLKTKTLELKTKTLELKKKNLEIKAYELIVQDREARLNAIVNSMRWKIPNYFYKIYKKRIKKYVPRVLFKLKDVLLFIIKLVNRCLRLLKLAWEEYRMTGWIGLKQAIIRHYVKKNSELLSYPKADDYIEGLVSVGILTKDRLDLIKPCIESIEKNLSKKYKVEILIGDTGTTDRNVLKYYEKIKKKYRHVRIVKFKRYFFSKNYNDLMLPHARGQYLIFLNNDTVAKKGWIDNLVGPLENKKFGIVGGKLLYKNGTIQHAGVIFDVNSNGIHACSKEKKDVPEASYKALCPSVTFACAATRHDVFNRFKLCEEFKEEAQDTDFSFRLADAGYQVLYNPKAEIFHEECSSRDWRKGEEDRQLFRKKWGYKVEEFKGQKNQRRKFNDNEYEDSYTVIRDDGIGDLLMAVSSFHKLRKENPDKKIILATYERNIEMMRGFGIFDEFIPIPNGQKYSPLPIPKDSKVYNLVSFEMKVTATQGIPTEDNKIHRHLVFSKIMNLDDKFKFVPMPKYPEAKKEVKKLFDKMKVNIHQNFVVLNLVSTNPARSWWEPYYPALINAIEKMGFVPIVVGTKDSNYYQSKKIINLVGKTKTITEFIEVIKLGKYVISTDTSAYHIAALSGIPFLAIFTGGVLPEARLKYYQKYEVLEPPKSLKCYPCWDEGCKDPEIRWKKDPCRLIIKPEQVIKKFKDLVKKYP